MKTRFFLAIAAVCLLCWTLPSSAQVPITVFPDPVQFGTIPLKSSGSTIVYLDNTTAAAAVISAISITGTNNADFSLLGTCVGTISAGQYCQLPVSFTPAALGARSASLQISVLGVTTAILIPLEGTGGNPGPTITSLSPASVYQNSAATTVTITGSGFLSTSLAYFGYGTPLATTFVSATELKAVVPASDLSSTGTYAIAVTNANGSTSSNFNIVGLDPIVQSVSPSSLVAGNAATSIILSGSNFQTGAKVLWNGTALTTTYLSSGQLQAQASAANLASAGIVELAVSNPAPGGLSSPVSLDVTYPVTMTILDLPANDLVWDPFAQLIYASLPSSYGVNGNSIAVINPTTGVVTAYHYAGSEPTKLALSADGKYLYVGLNGDGSVQRMVLPNFTLDINVSLGTTGRCVEFDEVVALRTFANGPQIRIGIVSIGTTRLFEPVHTLQCVPRQTTRLARRVVRRLNLNLRPINYNFHLSSYVTKSKSSSTGAGVSRSDRVMVGTVTIVSLGGALWCRSISAT
jgi:hypothetical protein